MQYLFRSKKIPHCFITAEDVGSRYTVLCGFCGYPIGNEEETCPRCQRDLDTCPVCHERQHKMCVLESNYPDPLRITTCTVCGTRQKKPGNHKLSEIEGMFCSNMYGCPAGGLLVRGRPRIVRPSEKDLDRMECEMVILPKGASQCPICLDTRFPTLDLSTFFYHASRCEFCSILYKSTLDDAKVESIRDGSSKYDCPLCGQISGGKKEEVSTALVAGAVDLARALMIFEKDEDTFNVVFHEWFKIPGTGSKVSDVVEYLLEVTVSEPHKAVLDRRLEVFLEGWKRKLPAEGAAFKFG